MKCTTCGAELRDGSKFCPSCGAPAPETDAAAETPDPATPRPARGPRKRRVPIPLVVALAALGIATAASAGYLVYALVIDPLPPAAEQPAEKADEAEKNKATDQDAKQDDVAETDAEADDTAATEPEETPAQEPTPTEEAPSAAPAVTHDFECDAFYVDVPDSWVRSDASPGENDPMFWGVTDNGNGSYFFHCSNYISTSNDEVYIGVAAPSYCTYFGTTSDGRDVYIGVPAGGSFFSGGPVAGPTITLK